MDQEENDKQHGIKNAKEETEAIQIKEHESNDTGAKHHDE